MSKKLLRCSDCNRLLLLGPHNRAPSYRFQGDDLEPIELHCDDEAAFREEHRDHNTDALRVVPDSFVSTGSWGDPMRESYFEATDGRQTHVIRRWRTHLDRPVIYEVVPGILDVQTVSIEVQRGDLEQQLEIDCGDSCDAELLARFVSTVEEVAESLEYDELEEVCADRRDPLINYLRLSDKQVAEILARLGDNVPPGTLKKLRAFILENNEADDAMNLIARKAFTIRDPSQGNSPASEL